MYFTSDSVFSGYVKEIDKKPAANVWGKKMSLGDVMAEFGTGIGAGRCLVFVESRSLALVSSLFISW
jgi:hypothetical protein